MKVLLSQNRILSELEQMNVKPQKVTAEKDNVSLVCLIEPSLYRALDDLIKNKLEGIILISCHNILILYRWYYGNLNQMCYKERDG